MIAAGIGYVVMYVVGAYVVSVVAIVTTGLAKAECGAMLQGLRACGKLNRLGILAEGESVAAATSSEEEINYESLRQLGFSDAGRENMLEAWCDLTPDGLLSLEVRGDRWWLRDTREGGSYRIEVPAPKNLVGVQLLLAAFQHE